MSDVLAQPVPVGRSLWADARIRLFRNKAAVTSLFFLFILLTETLMDFATRGWVNVPQLMH